MASIEYVVNATDAASRVFEKIGLSADHLDHQLEDLGKRVADPEVKLDDAKFTLGMIRAAERLDKLSAKVADPTVDVDTAKAQVEILRINAMLDRLGAKKVTAEVKVDVDRGMFGILGQSFLGAGRSLGRGIGGIGGLLGGGIGGAGQAIGGGVSALGQYGQGALYGAAALLAAALAPVALPLGIGGLVGGGAAGGALALGASAQKQLKTLQTSLRTATGARRQSIRAQIAELRQQSGGELGVFGAFSGLGEIAKSVFSGALEARGQPVIGPSGRPIAGTGAASFLTGLTGILKQIGGFVKQIGPQLGDMFRASVPFLSMFVKFLEQAAKALLPAFVQMLNEMQPLLPVITKGLMDIVRGFVGFLNAIGPSGMKAAARIFVILAEGMAGALVALGHTINWLTENIPTWTRKIHHYWDVLRHETAVIFDGIRHDIAHIWDMIFNNTLGRLERGRHDIAVEWDKWRHDIAHAWDSIYNDTIGTVIRLDKSIIGWFTRLPGQILRALFGLGHSLYAFARSALGEFWSGLKSVWSSVWGWLKNTIGGIPHAIMSFLHMSPPHPGSAFYDLGANMMHHLEAGMRARVQSIGLGTILGGMGGAGGTVTSWITSALRIAGKPMAWLPALQRLVSLESGGNPRAVNPIAVLGQHATGLWQMLPSTAAAEGYFGSLFNPILEGVAALRYISSRYGSPYNIPGLFTGGYRGYDRGGWLPPGLTLAMNATGRPERILPPGAGGATFNIHVNVPVSANKADVGRQVVEAIREYEMRSGAGWRK